MRVRTRLLVAGAFVGVLAIMSAPAAIAQIPEASFLRIEERVDVGGTILEPGSYVIRVLPSIRDRNILQVTNEDRSKVFATVLSIPHAVLNQEPTDTTFVFFPAIDGSPRALRTWYAPHSASGGGHDIVYPQQKAMLLAAAVKEPVVAYKDETPVEQFKSVPLAVVTPEKKVVAYVPPPKPVVVADAGDTLPQSAGELPLVATLGLLLVGIAVGIRTFRMV